MDFYEGQLVMVNPDPPHDCGPSFEGVIVSYWRNGAWVVRELVHQTTCAYDVRRLEAR